MIFFILFLKKIEKIIKKEKQVGKYIDEKGGLDLVAKHESKSFVDALYKGSEHELYIVSFCGENKSNYVNNTGLLSQWRGYGAGGGIALVFNTQKLSEMVEIEFEKYSYAPGHINPYLL